MFTKLATYFFSNINKKNPNKQNKPKTNPKNSLL